MTIAIKLNLHQQAPQSSQLHTATVTARDSVFQRQSGGVYSRGVWTSETGDLEVFDEPYHPPACTLGGADAIASSGCLSQQTGTSSRLHGQLDPQVCPT